MPFARGSRYEIRIETPLFFGPEERPLFGWIHAPDAQASPLGVVVCPPFGYEAICSHRALRRLARSCADASLPTLRFDLDGTGDSAGGELDPKRVATWIASVDRAIQVLRATTGVARVVLVGVRLGALLAASLTPRDDVAALIAIAPILRGKAYLRELRALQHALRLRAPPPGVTPDEEIQEAVGFALAKETQLELAHLDLLRATSTVAPRIWILDRDDLSGSEAWASHLRDLGVQVDRERVPGYLGMMRDPHLTDVPREMIDAVVTRARSLVEAAPASAIPSIAERDAVFEGVHESPCFLEDPSDGRPPLFGVLTEPLPHVARTGRAILFVNAGAVSHVGPNRLHVTWARRFARLGHVVLRLDLAGLGDSQVDDGLVENDVDSPRATDDLARAVTWLRTRIGITSVIAAGVCRGAYQLLRAASRGVAFDVIVPVNPVVFFWRETRLGAPAHRWVKDVGRYRRALRSRASWARLARGRVDVRRAAQAVISHARSLVVHRARDVARALGLGIPRDVGGELEAIARRGTRLRFVFSSDDPGRELLGLQGGTPVRRLLETDQLRIQIVPHADHTFTQLWSHELVTSELDRIVGELPR